jgi:PPOX class probable FMN-dependent enzyme
VDSWQITAIDDLVDLIGTPGESARTKSTPYLTPLVRDFILASPYVLMSTSGADGTCDVTPRGDPPGSIAVLDDRTLAIPDRLGNRRIDSMRNILENPHIGLLFLVPGTDETVRVNGRATITRDPALLERLAMNGKLPKVAIVVEIEEAFAHCARSILRSKLWDPAAWPDPDTIPTLAAMMAEQKHLPPPDESTGKRNEDYRKTLY